MNVLEPMTPSQILFSERVKAARARMANAGKYAHNVPEDKPAVVRVVRIVRKVDAPTVRMPTVAHVPQAAKPKWLRIVERVATEHGISVREIMSNSRYKNTNIARQAVYYALRQETALSYPEIGRRIGRDHSSVIHGEYMHKKRMGLLDG